MLLRETPRGIEIGDDFGKLVFTIEDVETKGQGVTGFVTVHNPDDPVDKDGNIIIKGLHRDKYWLGLCHLDSPSGVISKVERAVGQVDLITGATWEAMRMAVSHYRRRGQTDIQDVAEMAVPENRSALWGHHIYPGSTSVFMGEAASGKSHFLLWVALQVVQEGKRVIWCDYEEGESDWLIHLDRIRNGLEKQGLPSGDGDGQLLYYSPAKCLRDETRLRRRLEQDDVDLLIVDSLIPATGKAQDEEASGAVYRVTAGTHTALAFIAHPTKHGAKSDTTPFGSVVNRNQARNIFRVDSAKEPAGLTLAISDMKHGNTDQLAYQLAWNARGDNATAITVTTTDPGMVDGAAGRLSIPDRIKAILKRGSLNRQTINAKLQDEDETIHLETVAKAIKRGTQSGWLVEVRPDIFGLASTRTDNPPD